MLTVAAQGISYTHVIHVYVCAVLLLVGWSIHFYTYFFHIADVENERARTFFYAKITKLAMQKKRCLLRTYDETTRQY